MAAVESDNKTIRDEFNVQRAKLKELFLQKEGLFQNQIHSFFITVTSISCVCIFKIVI